MTENNSSVVRIRPHLKIFKGMPSFTSFISMFFILLIFFMMGSNFVPVQGIPVVLPQSPGELTYAAKSLIVSIDKDGNIFFDDTIANGQDKVALKRRISDSRTGGSSASGNRREQLIIRADERAPYATISMLFSIAGELDMNAILMTRTAPVGSKIKTISPE